MATQIKSGQRTVIGIFAALAAAVSYVDPTTYTESVKSSSSTPPPKVTLGPCPVAVVLDDGNGNTQNVAIGDKVWILDALPDGADVVVSGSGLPNGGTVPDLELTTAAVVNNPTFGFVSTQLPPGV